MSTFPATRISTLAKALEDKGNLMPYYAATTLQVVATTPTLLTRLALVEHEGALDWRPFKPLVEEAQRQRGKPEADQGTNIHLVVQALVEERAVMTDDATMADARAVLAALQERGLDPVGSEEFLYAGGLTEPLAGTRDLRCQVADRDQHVAVDIKSTSALTPIKYGSVSWAIQLAGYAHGKPYPTEDLVRDGWGRPMIDPTLIQEPDYEMDLAWGVVVEVERGTGRTEFHRVDLDQGWALAEQACQTRAARKAKVLA